MVIIEDIGASVLARLKNETKSQKIPFQQILILFAQEELLREISISSFNDNFVLKGGLLIYSLSGFSARPTILNPPFKEIFSDIKSEKRWDCDKKQFIDT